MRLQTESEIDLQLSVVLYIPVFNLAPDMPIVIKMKKKPKQPSNGSCGPKTLEDLCSLTN